MRRKSEKTQNDNQREASEAGQPDVSPVTGRQEGGEAIAVPSLRQVPGGVQQGVGAQVAEKGTWVLQRE